MRKMTDRLALAAMTSLIGNMPTRIIIRIVKPNNDFVYDFDALGAGLFLDSPQANTTPGRLTGFLVNEVNNLVFATALTYLLSATGRDHAVMKGTGLAATVWVLMNGIVSGSMLRKKSAKPWAPLGNLAIHLLNGALSGLVASTLGDDPLFPDGKIKSKYGKLPVMYVGTK